MDNLVKVQCILETGYNDTKLGELISYNQIYYVDKERAEFLKDKKAIKILKDEVEEIEKPRRKSRRML